MGVKTVLRKFLQSFSFAYSEESNQFQFDEQLKTAAYDDVGGCAIAVMLGQNVS